MALWATLDLILALAAVARCPLACNAGKRNVAPGESQRQSARNQPLRVAVGMLIICIAKA